MGNRATIATLAQAGVQVTSPTDRVEREATAVADTVVRAPAVAPAPVVAVAPLEETDAHRIGPAPAVARRAAASGVHAARPRLSSPQVPARLARSQRPGFHQTPLPVNSDGHAAALAPARPRSVPFVARIAAPAMPRGPPASLPPVIAAGLAGGSPV
ncbi:MAG: hypothetical protein KIT69_02350, partial [Propionibacteriaceae bacterium]|nr:hypothetical protein [Propionibacteriaceae bacterium]